MKAIRKSSFLAVASVLVAVSFGVLAYYSTRPATAVARGGDGDSVAARLGGVDGIRAFLETKVVPAELADPEIGPFFAKLTETPGDIEDCLARLLDHDLGGVSAKNGTMTATGHICRSSMSGVHHDMGITDHAFTRFIQIVGEQAAAAGVAKADIEAVAKRLETYRGSIVRN